MDLRDSRSPKASAELSLLDELVIRYLDELEESGEDRLEDLCAEHPEAAPSLRSRVSTLQDAGLLAAVRLQESPDRLGEFTLLRRLGQGGMGVVYLARQAGLERLVALKLLRQGAQQQMPNARARFSREITAVARLSHPGIVPIHTHGEVGEIPYYAMEFIEGASLADILHELEFQSPGDLRGEDLLETIVSLDGRGSLVQSDEAAGRPFFAGSWTEVCLRIAHRVAAALEHAHARGVVHRDIKPSNIMLTRDGRVMILDFGLAGLSEATRLTQSGSQLGSLPYLPPEELEGTRGSADPRVDVYGLGISLYESLALRLPYEGGRIEALQRKILDGRPIRPRTWNPTVTADVETVCLQAMAPDVSQRYGDVASLARDLKNLIDRRPIEARPPGPWARSVRYVQRNPAKATALGLAVLLIVVGPTAFGIQATLAADRIETAKLETDRLNLELESTLESVQAQTLRATEHYADARGALDLLTRVAREELTDIPLAQEAQRKLLNATLDYYRRLAEREGESRDSLGDVAMARARMAQLHHALGESLLGLEQVNLAIEGLRSWGLDRVSLGEAYAARAHIFRDLGRLDEAIENGRSAVDLWAAQAEQDDPTALAEFASHSTTLASSLRSAGRFREGSEVTGKALDAIERRIALGEADFESLETQALTLQHHSALLQESGDPAGGEKALLESIEIYDALLDEQPSDRALRTAQLANLSSMSRALDLQGKQLEGGPFLERAILLGEALIEEFPRLSKPFELLSNTYSNHGILRIREGDPPAGLESLRRSVELIDSLAAKEPGSARLLGRRCAARSNLASVLGQLKQTEEKFEVLREGIELARGGLAVAPDEHLLRVANEDLRIGLAGSEAGEGRYDRAWAEFEAMEPSQIEQVEMFLAMLDWALWRVEHDPDLESSAREPHRIRVESIALEALRAHIRRGGSLENIRASFGELLSLEGVAHWIEDLP